VSIESTGSFENQPRGSVFGRRFASHRFDGDTAIHNRSGSSSGLPFVCPTLDPFCRPQGRWEGCSKVLVRRASAWRRNCRKRARRAQSYGVALRSSSTRRYRTASRLVVGLSSHDSVHVSAWPQGLADHRTSGGWPVFDRLNRELRLSASPECLRTCP